MSKIWNLLGLAVLGIVLLVGMAAAGVTQTADVTGCLIDDLELTSAAAPDAFIEDVNFAFMPAVAVSGGSLHVLAASDWAIDVADDDDVGKMLETGSSPEAYLTDPLKVNTHPLDTTKLGVKTEIGSGDAAVDCDDLLGDDVPITYDQTILGGTAKKHYEISLTYTLRLDP